MLEPGATVEHYRIVRLVGQGRTGEVYLARDTRLGRKVALKVIHREVLGDAQAVERFLSEARATARFNQPHIVTVYGVGEHCGSPYVALEYLEGRSLRERLDEQQPGPREALRLGLAIAEALRAAHEAQVLHRDLKPENVMLGRDGRLRVVDFGLAKALSSVDPGLAKTTGGAAPSEGDTQVVDGFRSTAGTVAGTPLYMAPEQWRGETCTGATDVWALGLILHEMLCGRLPWAAPSVGSLCRDVCSAQPAPPPPLPEGTPAPLAELLGRCLAKRPEERPAAHEAAAILDDLLRREHVRADVEAAPFRGLLPFTEDQAHLFFGRDDEVAAFVERLRGEPVLPVVGPSGAGKSSFVQAGVIPRLREQGRWIVLRLRPGGQPFQALASRLRRGDADGSAATTRRRGSALPEAAAAAEAGPPGEADLVAQLLEAPARLALLLQRTAEEERARVLLFVDQLEEVYARVDDDAVRRRFLEAVCGAADDPAGPVRVVLTLRDDFLGRLAEAPAARRALEQITIVRSPGPEALRDVLQRPVAAAGYRYEDPALVDEMLAAVRGEPACLPLLQFACSQLWERRNRERRVLGRLAYQAMGGVEGAVARHADGVLDGLSADQTRTARQILLRLVRPDGTRRAAARPALLEGLAPQAEEVLDRLVRERAVLVRRARGEAGGAEVELVHESLVRNWERLRRWVDESREELRFLAEVGQAAELWEKRGRRDEEVWQGPALQEALARAERAEAVPDRVREFLARGAARPRRRARRRRAAVVLAMALLAALAAVLAWQARRTALQRDRAEEQRALAADREREAQRERREADAQRARALQESAAGALERGDVVEARAKLRSSLERRDSPEARALWLRLAEDPLRVTGEVPDLVWSIRYSRDGGLIAVQFLHRSEVYLVDARTGRTARVLRAEPGCTVTGVDFSPEGRWVAVTSSPGGTRLWRREDWTAREIADGGAAPVLAGFGAEPDTLLVFRGDGSIALVDAATGRTRREEPPGEPGGVVVARDPELRFVALWHPDGTIRIRAVDGGAETARLRAPDGARPVQAALAGDGGALAAGDAGSAIRIWEAGAGAARLIRPAGPPLTSCLAFSPDGRLLAECTLDGTVRLWDVAGGGIAATLASRHGRVTQAQFSPDGRSLAAGAHLGAVYVWDVAAAATRRAAGGHDAPVRDVSFSPDGATLATATTPDGSLVCAATADGTIEARDAVRDERLFEVPQPGVRAVAAAGDGCASLDGEGTVRLHDRAGVGRVLCPGATALAADGAGLLVAADRRVRVFDAAGREQAALPADVGVTAVGRLGSRIAIGYREGSIDVVGAPGAAPAAAVTVAGTAGAPVASILAGAADTFAAGFADGTLGVWTADGGRLLYRVRLNGAVEHLALVGGRLHAATDTGDHRTIDLGVFRLPWCEVLRQVWADVPVVWDAGAPVARPPPADHPCAP